MEFFSLLVIQLFKYSSRLVIAWLLISYLHEQQYNAWNVSYLMWESFRNFLSSSTLIIIKCNTTLFW